MTDERDTRDTEPAPPLAVKPITLADIAERLEDLSDIATSKLDLVLEELRTTNLRLTALEERVGKSDDSTVAAELVEIRSRVDRIDRHGCQLRRANGGE